MSDPTQQNEDYLQQLIASSQQGIQTLQGAERVLAYTTWSLLKEGYYSPQELINLSLQCGFTLDNPISKIKRGTRIGESAIIKNGTIVDGEDVHIGVGSILDNAQISGSHISIGERNLVSGPLLPGNITIGAENEIRGITGSNDGTLVIGNYNKIDTIALHNVGKQSIIIGNYNELHRGLSINCPFQHSTIRIGDYNSLGRDGGGVISTAYRFNKRWWGDILIGSHVETTRGAEILGFSLLGWPLSEQDEQRAMHLFVNGPLSEVISFFDGLKEQELSSQAASKTISLFGVVKVKMSCLTGIVKLKDGTRVQSSYLRNINIPERSKVHFSVVNHPGNALNVSLQDRAIECLTITDAIDWSALPSEERSDGYRKDDEQYYINQE